ncbi:FecR domain-containing protein [Membranicola marinus]|uniref:FecR domain-containing protein n=1 Tax=Membranihabitans marinus TaxID=1227546 RepID=A0A953HVU7_9BACT|nr:FecR domain-containing protein [Membranihabitans marinus]MBY5959185.1 FecR domain-containing protein [Membranihabitans marinus]
MKDEERIKYLSRKYFDGTLTKEEWEEVLWRVDRAEEADNIDELFKSEWQRTDKPHQIPHVTWEDMQSHWNSERKQNKIVTFPWKWAVAASVLALVSAIWWVWGQQEQSGLTYETGYGETQDILLDDGTSVTLNANSKLMWNKNWEETGVRVAELVGEAYFDVSHIDAEENEDLDLLPFQVQTPELLVNVLGTAFNVSSRRGETNVFLERGLVKLDLGTEKDHEKIVTVEEGGRENSEPTTNEGVLMKPGDHVSFSTTTKLFKKNDGEKYTNEPTWINGTLSFRKMEFGKILTELEDIYGKQFNVEDSTLLTRKVSLAVPYENWETVYKLIEVTLNLEIITDYDNNRIKIKKRAG